MPYDLDVARVLQPRTRLVAAHEGRLEVLVVIEERARIETHAVVGQRSLRPISYAVSVSGPYGSSASCEKITADE